MKILATRMKLRSDDGSILPLTIFFGVLALALVLVVVAASSLYLERKRLLTLADGAALVGAEAFRLEDVAPTADGFRPQLVSADISSAAENYLAGIPTAEFHDLAIVRAETTDGRSATVTLSAEWQPPIVTLLYPEGVRVEVTAVARSVFD